MSSSVIKNTSFPFVDLKIPEPPLQRELYELSRRCLGARRADILGNLFGWLGEEPKYLREIGEKYSLTRERIRQIRNDALDEIERQKPKLPLLEKLIDDIIIKGIINLDSADQYLKNKSLVSGEFSWKNLELLISLRFPEKNFSFAKIGSKDVLGSRLIIDASLKFEEFLRRASMSSDIIDWKKSIRGVPYSTIDFFKKDKRVVVSEDNKWAIFQNSKSGNLEQILGKIADVVQKIKKDDLISILLENESSFSKDAIVFWCFNHPGLYLVNDEFELNRDKIFGGVTPTEAKLIEEMRKLEGGVCLSEIESICEDVGLNKNTVRLYLTNSPIFKRVEKGSYILLNEKEDIDFIRMRTGPKLRKRKRALRSCHIEENFAFAEYEVTLSSLNNGVISLPAKLKDYIIGSVDVFDFNEDYIGSCNILKTNISGLRCIFKSLKLNEGDIIVFKFDKIDNKIIISIKGF